MRLLPPKIPRGADAAPAPASPRLRTLRRSAAACVLVLLGLESKAPATEPTSAGAPATPAATPGAPIPSPVDPECTSLAVLAARLLLDSPATQGELSRPQIELLVRCEIDMEGIEVPGIDLRGAKLERARLRAADLSGARLAPAPQPGGSARPARLANADLNGAFLEGADLTGAVLRHADLRHTLLAGAVFAGADLSGARLGWPQAQAQQDKQKLTTEQLDSACWDPGAPPQLPTPLAASYRRDGDPSCRPPAPATPKP